MIIFSVFKNERALGNNVVRIDYTFVIIIPINDQIHGQLCGKVDCLMPVSVIEPK